MSSAKLTRPAGLGTAGARFWRSLTADFEEWRPDELALLSGAARRLDVIAKLEAELEHAPVIVRGSQGQPVAQPLYAEVRAEWTVFARLCKQLGLEDAAEIEQARDALRAQRGRRNAAKRWPA